MVRSLTKDQARLIRQFFDGAGYSEISLRDRLGLNDLPWRKLRNRPALVYKTDARSALHVLARLFFVGQAIPLERASGAIPGEVLDALSAAGLVRREGSDLVPECMVAAFGPLLLACDVTTRLEVDEQPDLVLAPSQTTRMLSHFAIRRPVGSVLDLGSGCGTIGLGAAAFAGEVVATDVNPRAVGFTALNAALNGIDNISWLEGDTFQPVEGREFDLILSNPPFFLSPVRHLLYSDSPLELDGFCRILAREAPRYLRAGGFFQMLCEWVHIEGQPWEERLAEWFRDSDCDVLVLRGIAIAPADYTQRRMWEANPAHPERDGDVFDERMRYYAESRVQAMYAGMVAMRRRSGRNWLRIEEMPDAPARDWGNAVLERFAAIDFLETHQDPELLEMCPRLSDLVRLKQECRPSGQRWRVTAQVLEATEGIPAELGLDPLVAEVVARFDGTRKVRQLAADLAGTAGLGREKANQEMLRLVRRLLQGGFLSLPG